MKSVNYSLRKAYNTALSGITYNSVDVPVYYKKLPDYLTPDNYIIFDGVSNNDISTLHTSDTSTSIRVSIYTRNEKSNSGKACDDIAGIVLQRIYPNNQFVLDLSADGFQIISTKLGADNQNDWTTLSQLEYIDRFLVFTHNIYHR